MLTGDVHGSQVPPWAMPVICLLAPIPLFMTHTMLLRRRASEVHHLVLGLFAAVLFTGAVTNIIKLSVGRLRPDFIARCARRCCMWLSVLSMLAAWSACSDGRACCVHASCGMLYRQH